MPRSTETTITATTHVVGLHCWPTAPDRRAYLRAPHRHVFGLAVEVSVEHSDRFVEWHDLADDARAVLASLGTDYHPQTTLVDFGRMSCEELASETLLGLTRMGYAVRKVSVDEDREHTAHVAACSL